MRAKWLRFGDRNMSYFHNFTNQRKKRNTIKVLRDKNGEWVEGEKKMAIVATDYFKELFSMSPIRICEHVLFRVQPCLMESMNN